MAIQNSISSNKPVITGSNNTAVGANAFTASTSGNNNTAFGANALLLSDGASGNTCIGQNAGGAITSNGPNTALGNNALAALSNSTGNVAIGSGSLASATNGDDNISIGNNTLGVLDGGNRNVAIGGGTLGNLVSGNNNVCIGINSMVIGTGGNNVCVGYNAGYTLDTGGSNVCVGYHAGYNYVGAESNNILLGNTGTVSESNVIHIGDTAVQTTCFIAGVNGVSVTATGTVVIDSSGQLGTVATIPTAPFTYTDETSSPITLVANNDYTANLGTLLTFNMPATVAYGSIFEVIGKGTGLWSIVLSGGQTIKLGAASGTTSISSTLQYDNVKIVCIADDTLFSVVRAVGNLTLV